MAKTKKRASIESADGSVDLSFVKGSAEAKAKMAKMRAMQTGGKRKKENIDVRCGVNFPVHRVKRQFRAMNVNNKVNIGACIYMTGVIEYLCAEVLELAGNAARDNKKKTIKPRFIQLAINNDDEFVKVLGNVTFAQGGVNPHIHPNLLPRTKPLPSEWKN